MSVETLILVEQQVSGEGSQELMTDVAVPASVTMSRAVSTGVTVAGRTVSKCSIFPYLPFFMPFNVILLTECDLMF